MCRHRVDKHLHRFIDINIVTDFKPELISLWNLGIESLANIPFHKRYFCSETFKKGKLCKNLDLIKLTLRIYKLLNKLYGTLKSFSDYFQID